MQNTHSESELSISSILCVSGKIDHVHKIIYRQSLEKDDFHNLNNDMFRKFSYFINKRLYKGNLLDYLF